MKSYRFFVLFFMLAGALFLSSCQGLLDRVNDSPLALYQNVPFMVRIVDDFGTFRGTGFLVSPTGLVLTVSHVVRYHDPIKAFYDGKTYLAETVFDDPVLDVTLIRLPLPKIIPNMSIPCFWDSDTIRYGDPVLILGQEQQGGVRLMPGYMISWSSFRIWPGTYQDVFRIHPADPRNFPEPGFSGGPIFDLKRHIIGLFCCLENIGSKFYNGIPSTRILSRLRETEIYDEICVVSEKEPFPLPGLVFDINQI